MKLLEHVLNIRGLIDRAFQNRFERLGLTDVADAPIPSLSESDLALRSHLKEIVDYHALSADSYAEARKKAINECTFTFFNRLAAIKVMEDKGFFPEIIMRRDEDGKRSRQHNEWLEENPDRRNEEREGLLPFFLDRFEELAEQYPIFRADHPYALMPRADELHEIVDAFNAVAADADCGEDIWRGDDILGWLYENFNAVEKHDLKESGEKTEYDKVSLQSQVYTPQWVVKFLVDNTVGKMYLEMFPESDIDREPDPETGEIKYRIANRPTEKTRNDKQLDKWRIIDPACGSGNFLIYTMSLLYDLYVDQIDNFGADYSKRDIPALIIENNLYGVDLDERAVQLSQIALRIKARELGSRRATTPKHTNILCSNFFLPHFKEVQDAFDMSDWSKQRQEIIGKIWNDLGNAHKFGSLVRIEEPLKQFVEEEEASIRSEQGNIFALEETDSLFSFYRNANDTIREMFKQTVRTSKYASTKLEEALGFIDLLSKKFDVAVANPPYTDSGDFGPELKKFVDDNYKKPYKFHTNLYAAFIRRCWELTADNGKVGMIHPHTFMFIKSFEDVRKFLIEKTSINVMVDFGLDRVNLFGPGILLDATFYTFDKGTKNVEGIYFDITNGLQERYKKETFEVAYLDLCEGRENSRVYRLPQDKLRQIKSWPFIYWISDDFRKKFSSYYLSKNTSVISGFKTGKNEGALRHWWEVDNPDKWQPYTKGGEYNKWYGNVWLKILTENDFEYIKSQNSFNIPSVLDVDGITYNGSGSKGITYRILENDTYYDMGACCIFPSEPLLYLGILNSPLLKYSIDCLNPTVNKQPNDVNRLPMVNINEIGENVKNLLTGLVRQIVNIKKYLCQFSLIEPLYEKSPIEPGVYSAQARVSMFYQLENALLTQILLYESVINQTVFDIYELSERDRKMVLNKEGIPVGNLPVSGHAAKMYVDYMNSLRTRITAEESLSYSLRLWSIQDNRMQVELPGKTPIQFSFEITDSEPTLTLDFDRLYQKNYDWEEFCIQNKVNPIEAWYQFSIAQTLPAQRTQVLAFELITDVIRTLLDKDDDGVMPLVDRTGEGLVADRIQQEMMERGYTGAQFSQVCSRLGMPLDRYLRDKFFQQLSDHLNLFMYLPKTPFIWHLTSGPLHAMELYVSIYKWNRNTLSRVKSVYCANRESALRDRLATLSQSTESSAQSEAADIRAQLRELAEFTDKLDALLASGYDPRLDDGVGKNIAPLQKTGLLSYAVLKETGGNRSQLNKFLNADW